MPRKKPPVLSLLPIESRTRLDAADAAATSAAVILGQRDRDILPTDQSGGFLASTGKRGEPRLTSLF